MGTYYPILGDGVPVWKDYLSGVYSFEYLIRNGLSKAKGVWIGFMAYRPIVVVQNTQAVKEFFDLVPSHIDRGKELRLVFYKFVKDGFPISRSTDNWKSRRSEFMQTIGINHSSQFIPIILDSVKTQLDQCEVGKPIDFDFVSKIITFNIISKILFGKDIEKLISRLDYIKRDNSVVSFTLAEFFIELSLDLVSSYMGPATAVAPFINQYNLVKPFSRDKINADKFRAALVTFLTQTQDTESVYGRLMENSNYDNSDVLSDLLSFMLGGSETTAHLICSGLYCAQKYPQSRELLLTELRSKFPQNFENIDYSQIKQKIDECNYLSYYLKE